MNALNASGVISGDMPKFNASNAQAKSTSNLQALTRAELASGQPSQPSDPPNAAELEELNVLLQVHQQHLSFSIDEKSGATVMKVIDTESGDIIRQMPSESWLKLAQELSASSSGLLNDRA